MLQDCDGLSQFVNMKTGPRPPASPSITPTNIVSPNVIIRAGRRGYAAKREHTSSPSPEYRPKTRAYILTLNRITPQGEAMRPNASIHPHFQPNTAPRRGFKAKRKPTSSPSPDYRLKARLCAQI